MKLAILFITLLLGFSLNLMAEDGGETGKRPTEVISPAECLNNCPNNRAPGMASQNKKELALCKSPVGGIDKPGGAAEFHAESCSPEHETEGSNGKTKGNK